MHWPKASYKDKLWNIINYRIREVRLKAASGLQNSWREKPHVPSSYCVRLCLLLKAGIQKLMLSFFLPGRNYISQLLSTAAKANLPSTSSCCHDWLLFLFFFSEEEKTCRVEWAYFSQVQNWSVVPGHGGHSQWSVLHCGNLKAISALTEYLWCLCSVLCTNSWNSGCSFYEDFIQ